MSKDTSLKALLEKHTRASASQLVKPLPDGAVRCVACGHRCIVRPGRVGICKVRFNVDGELRAPWGYVAGLQIDPIEKKPFYHAYPARDALSFGMLGCDFHCGYCQNWVSSQTLRDDQASTQPNFTSPEMLVDLAIQNGAPVMVSTYNEPLITADWAVDVFRCARQRGIVCGFVSNGNVTPEVLEFIRPHVDLYKIDLKTFNDKRYRELGGVLENVLEGIRLTHAMGFWVEVVTLLVPGFNDSIEEMQRIAGFLAEVSCDIPWHVTAFHPDYKMLDPSRTPAETLLRACEVGEKAGLRYVYAGNLPGAAGEHENTRCPQCAATMIRRKGFTVTENQMRSASCSQCGTRIAGVWEEEAAPPRTGDVWPVSLKSC